MSEAERNAKRISIEDRMKEVELNPCMSNRYNLAVELIKYDKLETIGKSKLDSFRIMYGLNSAIWILAEMNIAKGIV